MKIKSFEVSDSGETGDILSKKKKYQDIKLRIGLICGGWFEWWQMFSDTTLEKIIKEDAEKFVTNLKKEFQNTYDIIYPQMIDTLDNANDVGIELKRENVDVIVIVENTYVVDFLPIEVIDHLPDIPTIIMATQATKSLPKKMTNIDVIRYEGLVGITQLVGAFRKMGRDYHVIAGAIDDPETYKKLDRHFKVLGIKKRLKRMDIGLLGHTFRGMYDIEIDKTKMKGVFGPNIIYIDVQHFNNIWDIIKEHEILEYKKQLNNDIPITKSEITQEDINKSIRVGIALIKLVERFNLDGISILGQHHLEVATRSSTDFSHYCVEKRGCMHTCEGDMGNLVMKIIFYQLSGSLPVFLEWTAFDEPTNTILLTHHGVVDVVHCTNLKKCRWTPSPEKWDFTGKGMSIEFCGKPGEVTLSTLIDDSDGWKILISHGECIEIDPHPCWAPQFYFKPKMKVTTYIEEIMKEGVAHHVCLVYGNYINELELIADYFKVRKVII